MPLLRTNGIQLSYQRTGRGRPVLMIMGSSAAGRVWTVHQTPALNAAGYETIVFDNRGIAPSDAPPGRYALADMVADTAGLIEGLSLGPCLLVGTSLGAMIAQELAVDHPALVDAAVLIATRGRTDAFRRALTRADQSLAEGDVRVPAGYDAATTVLKMFSPATLNDDAQVQLWLDTFELAYDGGAPNGQAWADAAEDRLAALRGVAAPCRVIAFADDLITPAHLGAEVADAIPDCDLVTVARAGHLGFLERPDEVNTAIVEFLDKHRH